VEGVAGVNAADIALLAVGISKKNVLGFNESLTAEHNLSGDVFPILGPIFHRTYHG